MKRLFAAEAEDEECESGKTTSEAFCALPGSATFFSPSLSHFVLSIFPTSPPSLTSLFSLSHNYMFLLSILLVHLSLPLFLSPIPTFCQSASLKDMSCLFLYTSSSFISLLLSFGQINRI